MNALVGPVIGYLGELRSFFVRGWSRFWFAPSDPTTLGFVRICTGLVLSYVYLTCIGNVDDFVGPHAWVDRIAMHQLGSPNDLAQLSVDRRIFDQSRSFHEWYFPSVYLLTRDVTLIRSMYAFFCLAMLCMTVGFYSRTAAVLSWVGHLSFAHRGYLVWYGLDCVLAMLLLYLVFSPSGAAWSIDAFFDRARRAKRAMTSGAPYADEPPAESWRATLTIRLIQVNMCLVYFCAGAAKLQGSSWWSGRAVWYTMMIPEFRVVDTSFLARIEALPWLPELVSNLGVAMTIGFEIGFAFLVYVRILRPLMLMLGVVLHAGIGLFMGLGSFGAAMLTGLASFIEPIWLKRFAAALLDGPGGYRFVLDRRDERQVDLASVLVAAGPSRQVEIVDAPSSAPAARAGAVIAPDGTVLTGFAAFGRCVRVMRPMWLLWPVLAWRFLRA
jgi:HTTM domain